MVPYHLGPGLEKYRVHLHDTGAGEMAEWLKAHAWKACIRETVSWVRIPLSPPLLPGQIFSAGLGRSKIATSIGFFCFEARAEVEMETRHAGAPRASGGVGTAGGLAVAGAIISSHPLFSARIVVSHSSTN